MAITLNSVFADGRFMVLATHSPLGLGKWYQPMVLRPKCIISVSSSRTRRQVAGCMQVPSLTHASMRVAKVFSSLLWVFALLIVVGVATVYFWGTRQAQVGYYGEWRLSADAMAEAMVDKGYSMIEVRKFYVANRGGLTRMSVDSERVVRTQEGKTTSSEYAAVPDSPGCWVVTPAGGAKERWCIVKSKLQVTSADGNTLIYRQEDAGNMKSDSAPMQ